MRLAVLLRFEFSGLWFVFVGLSRWFGLFVPVPSVLFCLFVYACPKVYCACLFVCLYLSSGTLVCLCACLSYSVLFVPVSWCLACHMVYRCVCLFVHVLSNSRLSVCPVVFCLFLA